MRTYLDAERCAIMERIRERCSTNLSPRAECSGRQNNYLEVCAWPYQPGYPRAEFSWSTADKISREGGRFDL
jgi:hypothetical protein